jgi:hypothetical protein
MTPLKHTDSQDCAAVGEEPLPPEYLPTLARLADLFNMSTAAMRDLRARDSRFAPKGTQGYSVYAVAHLLRARELERKTDEDFNADHRARARETIEKLDAGEWDHLGAAFVKRFRDVEEAVAAGRFDYGDGRTAREAAIADCLDSIRAAQEDGTTA